MKYFRQSLSGLTLAALAACATPPPPAPPPPVVNYSRQQAAYRQVRQVADHLEAQGRLREAVDWLQIAQAVSAGSPSVDQELVRLEHVLREQIVEAVKSGDQAAAAHDVGAAAGFYEHALALDPACEPAREALRAMNAKAILTAIAHGGGGGPPAPVVKH